MILAPCRIHLKQQNPRDTAPLKYEHMMKKDDIKIVHLYGP